MMFRSTLFLSAGLAVASVVLTSLWIGYGPRLQGGQDKRAAAVIPLSKQERTGLDAKGQPIRTITPESATNPGVMATAPGSFTSSVALSPDQSKAPKAFDDPGVPGRQPDTASISPPVTEIATDGTQAPPVTPGGNVDLNTATVEQLNALGAGMIGKRILEFRPYASTEDLITRRVLKRADFETIKGAVTVR